MNEGLSIFRTMMKMLFKLILGGDERTEMDIDNFAEMTLIFVSKCNYHATLEGLVISENIR